MRATWLILPLAALATSASAGPPAGQAPTQARQQCFWANQVTGFSDAGKGKAVLNIGSRQSWEMELSPGCSNVDWAMRIGIRSRGSDRICSGKDAELLIPEVSGTGFRRCLVRNVRLVPPQR